jgi:uncharacterized membrane protein YjgN (DUF898 family)
VDRPAAGPASPEAQAAPDAPPAWQARARFTGTGLEYFRIWVVHLLLTLLTLGVYSAWAKARKLRWFARHTELAGDRFDFTGAPWRILVGRVLALALVLLWGHSFDLSPAFGVTVLVLLCAVGPLLWAGAQRFRLTHLRWRGLAFGFEMPLAHTYAVCVPPLVVWALLPALPALQLPRVWLVGLLFVAVFGLPFAHARFVQAQRRHASFGSQRFDFESAVPGFYRAYARTASLAVVAISAMAGLTLVAVRAAGASSLPTAWIGLIAAGVSALIAWVLVWPFFVVRLQQTTWRHTRLGDVRFRNELDLRRLAPLVWKWTPLVLASAGLAWPFAAVALARLRVESVVVESGRPLDAVAASAAGAGPAPAAGDALADLLGVDFGW